MKKVHNLILINVMYVIAFFGTVRSMRSKNTYNTFKIHSCDLQKLNFNKKTTIKHDRR